MQLSVCGMMCFSYVHDFLNVFVYEVKWYLISWLPYCSWKSLALAVTLKDMMKMITTTDCSL